MKNLNKTLGKRNSERGAIVILIAAMWTTLFGLAAFAVDVGYLYTRQRGIQATADAAVVAGMPSIVAGNQSTAQTRANSVAVLNGYTGGDIVAVTPTANSLRVELRKTYPTFFGSILGLGSRTLTARSEARMTGGPPVPVIHANAGCGVGFGFTATGGATITVTGDIQSNGTMDLNVAGSISGQAKVNPACVGEPSWSASFTPPTVATTGPFVDPFLGLTPANFAALCTHGTLLGGDPMGTATWTCGAGPGGTDVLSPGIFCALGNISITNGCPGQTIYAPNSTFVSATGQIQFGANNGITLGPHPASLQNIVVITGNPGSPAVHLGAAEVYTINGAIYAPLGTIMCNGGGGGASTFTGSLVGSQIFFALSPGAAWTFSGGGLSGGGAWRLYQ